MCTFATVTIWDDNDVVLVSLSLSISYQCILCDVLCKSDEKAEIYSHYFKVNEILQYCLKMLKEEWSELEGIFHF